MTSLLTDVLNEDVDVKVFSFVSSSILISHALNNGSSNNMHSVQILISRIRAVIKFEFTIVVQA